jgi:uncharacterized protein YbjT (DUF2867 family)
MLNFPQYQAVVIGATGAVGSALLRELLASPHCASVTALVRRKVGIFDALPGRDKLKVALIDFAKIAAETQKNCAKNAIVFCTMGIGQPRKISFEEFWQVDVEYARDFAQGAAAGGARHISLLSSVGANAQSRNKYLQVKGAAEQAVRDANIAKTSLFRPSVLATKDIRYGLQDRLTQSFYPLISPFLPSQYHQIGVEDLAKAMRKNAENNDLDSSENKLEILHYKDFKRLMNQ